MSEDALHEIKVMLARMDERFGRIDERLTEVCEVHKAHQRVLFGARGDNGLSGRVSSLESDKRSRDWQIKALFGAVITAIGAAITNWLGRAQ